MKKILDFTEEIKAKVLGFLYNDELFNVYMIHYIENKLNNIGELYINEKDNDISEIVHLKYDGNSYFTNFYSKNNEGLKNISRHIRTLNYKNVLLAGKLNEVMKIKEFLGDKEKATPNIYYRLDIDRHKNNSINISNNFRRASNNIEDIYEINKLLIGFFQPVTEEETSDITNINKIVEDLEVGIYFIEYNSDIAGMARFSSKSKNYADITTVYIKPQYRHCGLGKQLMEFMIMTAIKDNKVPVTQTSIFNTAARKTYESLGFIRQDDYAFEFIF